MIGFKLYSKHEVSTQWNNIWKNQSLIEEEKTDNTQMATIILSSFKQSMSLENFNIIEAGCGQGKWIPWLESKFPKANIFGIDYSKRAVEQSSKIATRSCIKIGDITKLQFDDNTINLYLSFGVVEHLENIDNLQKAISEMQRTLAPNGKAIVSIPGPYTVNILRSLKNLCKAPFIKAGLYKAHFFEYLFIPKKFEGLLSNSKLSIELKVTEKHENILPKKISWLSIFFPFLKNHMTIYVLKNENCDY